MIQTAAAVWTPLVLVLFTAHPAALSAQEIVAPDTSAAASATMDSLEARLERSWWAGWLTDFIFVGRARSDSADVLNVTDIRTEDQYMEYGGRFIRRIDIARLPLFNTETVVPGGILKLGNAVHIDTRTRVIRGYVLMKEGSPLDPYVLADTERILRSTPFIQDATIVVIPVEQAADSVDLLVVTQDLWSIGATASVRGVGMYKFKLFERNFLGLGQVIETEFDVGRGRSQEVNFNGLYRVDNIRGSFVDFDLRYVDSHIENRPQATLSRPFRTVEIAYGGAMTLSRVEVKDTAGVVTRSYDAHDLWIGRAFSRDGAGFDGQKRAQFTVSGRVATTNYLKRESVDAESDRSLHDRTLLLGGVSWSHSEYRKALLLSAYGTTDDIGTGYLVGLTAGYEDGEFNDRWYAGGRLSAGRFGDVLGYYAWLVEAGGFFRRNDFQDGALRLNFSGFSRLSRPGRYRYRFFYGVDYLAGYDRQSASALALRVPGIDTDLADFQRLTLGLEGVAFAPWHFLGFRFSLFGSVNLGTVGPDFDSFLGGKYYSSLGLGFRLHSDRLVFGAYEVKLVYLPEVPAGASEFKFDFSTVRDVRGGDFLPGPPGPVAFE